MSGLAYFEWSADIGDVSPADRQKWDAAVAERLDDPAAWEEANPALGIRITREAIERERAAMEDEDFARERLGIFPDEVDSIDAVIDPDDWRACARPGSAAEDPVVFAFEPSVDRRWTSIGVAGRAAEGVGKHVELIDHRKGTGWVIPRLLELRDRHRPSAVICNPTGPAGALLADCERAGLDITLVGGADYAKACGAAYDEVVEHRWRHGNHPILNTAVSGAAKRTVGDTWVFDRRASVDIAPFVAVTLAAWWLGRTPEPTVHEWPDEEELAEMVAALDDE